MAKMPVRNKSKDNPYTLDFDEVKESYVVKFKDGLNKMQCIEISEEIYLAFDKFELEDISQIHKFRKHIEHSEIYEDTLNERMLDKPTLLEDEVQDKLLIEELYIAIDKLSSVQKRRVKMYYFDNLTLQQIADIENCSVKNVFKSLELAKEKMKKSLK